MVDDRPICREQKAELSWLIESIRQELGVRRPVRLWTVDQSLMPMTWGILCAELLLPREAKDWPTMRSQAVVLHELAHVKRWDCLTHLVAQIARAVYWFNPLAWLAVRQMEVERECACDDLVINAGIEQADYARGILEICTRCCGDASSAVAMPIIRASAVESPSA